MSLLQMVSIAVLLLSLTSLVAYGWGRRVGIRQGQVTGLRRAPLQLRMEACQTGQCPVCGTVAGHRGTMCQKG